jgi:hypothetical protein
MFFRGREFTIFGSLEPVKPRIRECAKFGNLDSVKKGGHEHAEAQSRAVGGPNFGGRPIRKSVKG